MEENFDADLDAKIYKAIKRMKPSDASRMGSVTEAQLVQDMVSNQTLIDDPNFDMELNIIKKQGEFWVESCDNPVSLFPAPSSGEKSTVQPFFTDVMGKFANMCLMKDKIVFIPDDKGLYRTPKVLTGDLLCIPDASIHETPTVGSRKPDVNVYHESIDVKGVLRVVSAWELKARAKEKSHRFADDEIGQLVDTNMELLRQQPFRQFTLAVLSDGVRFQFFKIKVSAVNGFIVSKSSVYLNMEGWSVRFLFIYVTLQY